MRVDPNEVLTTTHGSTGPRTAAGKAKSSRNAIRTGLYAARDFVRSGEEEEYAQTLIQLMDELTPEGTLEQTFATEIMGATWRLRRCRLIEESFGSMADLNLDPAIDEKTEKQQRSVDRARAQSHLILRRSIAELRKLQTERIIHQHATGDGIPLLTDVNHVTRVLEIHGKEASDKPVPPPSAPPPDFDALMALADKQLAQQYRESKLASFCKTTSTPAIRPAEDAKPLVTTSFCKEAKSTPRNAQCPCGSGKKFKRCCGINAPAVLNCAA